MKKREIHLAKKSDMINSIHNLKWPYVKKKFQDLKKYYQFQKNY